MAVDRKICFFYLYLLCVIFEVYVGGYEYAVEDSKVVASRITDKRLMPPIFGVQGIIYCKSSSPSRVFPLKGGVVRITCLGIDKHGYETAPFSILSRPTDSNGYFLAKLSSQLLEEDGVKISQCKAFLHSSPLKACPIATDANRGSSGAPLSAYRAVGSSSMRLYSVGPFVYTSGPQQTDPSAHY